MFAQIISQYGPDIIGTVLALVFGCLGFMLKNLAQRYIDDDTKRAVARTVVLFVEQVYKDLHGKDKLHAAMEALSKRLAEKKIMISEAEMEVLIEAAVAEFNEAFKRPALDAATADAVRRTPETD